MKRPQQPSPLSRRSPPPEPEVQETFLLPAEEVDALLAAMDEGRRGEAVRAEEFLVSWVLDEPLLAPDASGQV